MATNPTTTLPKLNIGSQPTLNMSGTPDYTSFFSPETISEQQYLTGGVDFYTQTLGTGIQSTVTDEDKSEEETKEDTGPNIFKPIGGDGNDKQQITSEISRQLTSGLDNTKLYSASELTPQSFSYNDKTLQVESTPYTGGTKGQTVKQKADLVGDFFSNFVDNLAAINKQSLSKAATSPIDALGFTPSLTSPTGKKSAMGIPPAATFAMGPGIGVAMNVLAGFSGAANMALAQQTAAQIKAMGGGAFMEIGGNMAYRKPGSTMYNGSLLGNSQELTAYQEAMQRGFVRGTLQIEKFDPATGKMIEDVKGTRDVVSYEGLVGSKGGFTETGSWMDLAGNTSYGTVAKQTQAYTDAVNQNFGLTGTSAITKSEIMGLRDKVQTSWSFTKGTHVPPGSKTYQDLVRDLVAEKQKQKESAVDRALGRTSGRGEEDQTFAEARAEKEAIDKMTETNKVPADVQAEIDKAMKEQTGGDGGGGSGGNMSDSERSESDKSDPRGESGFSGGFRAAGGRVGYQAGGEAGFAQRPEFVGGKQSQPDGVSVADDQPRDVQEGTFVINAAAADFAGRGDIEKMLRDAYKRVGDTGQSGVSQEVQIAVSKGEVIIPPYIAKEIGYDRLNKINNRGKKEIARRQEAAGGGFIDRKKFAKGDKVTVYRGEPLDPEKAPYTTDYGYGKENVGKFHSPSIERARWFTDSAGSGNKVIRSRKVTIDELFDGVKEAWKVRSKQENEYFSKMSKADLNKNLKNLDSIKKAYQSGERSLESMAHFLQEQVFHEGKSKINFIETLKNDPKSAGKLAGRAIAKAATVATPPVAFLMGAAEVLTPSKLSKGTMFDDSFMTYTYTYNK